MHPGMYYLPQQFHVSEKLEETGSYSTVGTTVQGLRAVYLF